MVNDGESWEYMEVFIVVGVPLYRWIVYFIENPEM